MVKDIGEREGMLDSIKRSTTEGNEGTIPFTSEDSSYVGARQLSFQISQIKNQSNEQLDTSQ